MQHIRSGDIGTYLHSKHSTLQRIEQLDEMFHCFLLKLMPEPALHLGIATSFLDDLLSTEGPRSKVGKLYLMLERQEFVEQLKAAGMHQHRVLSDSKETHAALGGLRQAWKGYVNIRVVRLSGHRHVLFRVL